MPFNNVALLLIKVETLIRLSFFGLSVFQDILIHTSVLRKEHLSLAFLADVSDNFPATEKS